MTGCPRCKANDEVARYLTRELAEADSAYVRLLDRFLSLGGYAEEKMTMKWRDVKHKAETVSDEARAIYERDERLADKVCDKYIRSEHAGYCGRCDHAKQTHEKEKP